jgi:manganese/zinc/iron transport system substrate-binding protein
MKRLKKVIFTLLGPLLILGCSGSKKEFFQENGKLKVLSTTAQIGDLVSAVGGNRIDEDILIKGDLDPHSYELVKGDGERLSRADLIFYNGLGLEHGASLSSYLAKESKAVAVGEKIQALHPEQILQRGAAIDPHVWMDIALWEKGIGPIVESLSQMDPEGADYYRQRGISLSKQMLKVHDQLFSQMQTIPDEKRYLVTSHDAFHYFTRAYLAAPNEADWAKRFAAPEGLAPEGQLNPRDIQAIIDYLREKKISVLFPESNVSRDSIRKIATAGKELGLDIEVCSDPLYGDAMSGLHYLEMMQANARVITEYLWNMQ